MQEQALRDGAFQSTPSAWRETAYRFYKIRIEEHFNPLPPHGGRRGRMYCRKRCMNFNPLPPYGGRLPSGWRIADITDHFNPLPPYGGRQGAKDYLVGQTGHFNPLPPYGGRPRYASAHCRRQNISIHSLRMEGDLSRFSHSSAEIVFQSTPSVWRETQLSDDGTVFRIFQSTPSVWRETFTIFSTISPHAISIHSLRMEGDDPPCVLRRMA